MEGMTAVLKYSRMKDDMNSGHGRANESDVQGDLSIRMRIKINEALKYNMGILKSPPVANCLVLNE